MNYKNWFYNLFQKSVSPRVDSKSNHSSYLIVDAEGTSTSASDSSSDISSDGFITYTSSGTNYSPSIVINIAEVGEEEEEDLVENRIECESQQLSSSLLLKTTEQMNSFSHYSTSQMMDNDRDSPQNSQQSVSSIRSNYSRGLPQQTPRGDYSQISQPIHRDQTSCINDFQPDLVSSPQATMGSPTSHRYSDFESDQSQMIVEKDQLTQLRELLTRLLREEKEKISTETSTPRGIFRTEEDDAITTGINQPCFHCGALPSAQRKNLGLSRHFGQEQFPLSAYARQYETTQPDFLQERITQALYETLQKPKQNIASGGTTITPYEINVINEQNDSIPLYQPQENDRTRCFYDPTTVPMSGGPTRPVAYHQQLANQTQRIPTNSLPQVHPSSQWVDNYTNHFPLELMEHVQTNQNVCQNLSRPNQGNCSRWSDQYQRANYQQNQPNVQPGFMG